MGKMKIVLVAVCLFVLSEAKHGRGEEVTPEYLDALLTREDYVTFSKLTGIPDPKLSKPSGGNGGRPFSHRKLAFGDIILTPQQKAYMNKTASSRFSGLSENFGRFPSLKWKKKKIPYSISKKYSRGHRNLILRAVTTFNSVMSGCLKWIPFKKGKYRDYVYFFPGDGCYTTSGRKGGPQALSLDRNGCMESGTALHEMAHVIGMLHEHNRPDRDKYIRVLHKNIAKDFKDQYIKVGKHEAWTLGKYDYYSVMHYSPTPSIPGKGPEFIILDKNVKANLVGTRSDFSSQDKAKMRKLYC